MAIEAFSQDNYNDGVPDVLGIDNGLNGSYDGLPTRSILTETMMAGRT
jgi:hypothetical protein